LSAALFNGDPAGAGPGNVQLRDASGTSFRVNDGAFAIAEASYAVNQDKDAPGQPATYKLGAWYHSGVFADERYDTTGQSLAAPSSTGIARKHTGDYGVYAVMDRGLWHDSGADRILGIFLRLGATPSDRNLVAFYADAGLNFKGLIAGRADDMFGLALAVAQISNSASGLDWDQRRSSGINTPIGDAESVLEATYRVQMTPWWTVQPDLQFIRHPGGHVAPSNQPSKAIPNAVLMGLRSAVLF